MKQVRKKLLTVLLAGCLTVFCCGCTAPKIIAEPEDLYSLPRLPEEYTGLENSINAILEDGGEYAAPSSGTNIQPVQMVDLDGDGREEALAFFRQSDGEKPLKIYVFSATFRCKAIICKLKGGAFFLFLRNLFPFSIFDTVRNSSE